MPELQMMAALLGGLTVLAFAGDFLVSGAVSAGRRLGVSPLVAGIFIVGFGTSAPEMVVAVDAALEGYPDIALGNIVGSNIANVFLVLGIPALIAPIAMTGGFGQKRTLTAMLIATAVWIVLSAVMPLNATIGTLFILGLVAYGVYTFVSFNSARKRGIEIDVEPDEETLSLPRTIAYTLVGIIGLPVGAHLIVEGGVGVARTFEVPEYVIGLTLIAIGTSLPEIGAGIAASLRGHGSVIIGNVLGSNLFNILGAGGLVAIFAGLNGDTLAVSRSFHAYDHWAMGLAALIAAIIIFSGKSVSRLAGILLLLIYALYIAGLTLGWDILALFGA